MSMYYVNKIVGWCTSPLGMLCIGLLIGALLRWKSSWRRTGAAVLVLALVQFWILSCGVTLRLLGTAVEGPEMVQADLPSADAVVLLGGGVGYHRECGRAEIFDGADRVWTAAKLMKSGKAPRLTVSGGGARGELELLGDFGVDKESVLILEDARNTQEEASAIAAAIKLNARILLVTSASHMPRARRLFERAGFEVIPVPTDYEAHYASEEPLAFGDFLPSAGALDRNTAVIKEIVARTYFLLRGI